MLTQLRNSCENNNWKKKGDTDNALYDQTLTRASGAGLLFNQVVRRMSHAVVSGSSDAVLSVLRRL